jgi:hypothetical protein
MWLIVIRVDRPNKQQWCNKQRVRNQLPWFWRLIKEAAAENGI